MRFSDDVVARALRDKHAGALASSRRRRGSDVHETDCSRRCGQAVGRKVVLKLCCPAVLILLDGLRHLLAR